MGTGAETEVERKEERAGQLEAFFGHLEEAKTSSTTQAIVPSGRAGGRTKERKAAVDHLQGLDHALKLLTGQGLKAFADSPTGRQQALVGERKLLVLHMDEGSVGFSGTWYLQYKAGVRCAAIRDIYHREWNDATLALVDCALQWVVQQYGVICNLPRWPLRQSGLLDAAV